VRLGLRGSKHGGRLRRLFYRGAGLPGVARTPRKAAALRPCAMAGLAKVARRALAGWRVGPVQVGRVEAGRVRWVAGLRPD
jgi:hypothetical protein